MNTMEGTIDIRLVARLAGILVSVATAAAIARQQIKVIEDAVKDMEQRLRGMDRRMDQAESGVSVHEQRVQVLSSMLSPETQERRHKEIANLQARIGANEKDLLQLKLLHNSEHPYIPKPTLP